MTDESHNQQETNMTIGDLVILLRDFPEENEIWLGDDKGYRQPVGRAACVSVVNWNDAGDCVISTDYTVLLP